MKLKLEKGFRQFIVKTIIFLALFIIVSGIIGPWVISTKLLYSFHFFIYGGLGKLVLFAFIALFHFIFYQTKTYSLLIFLIPPTPRVHN